MVFFKAHLEFMAEKLKKKIEAIWGPTADKAAEALIERMGSQWYYGTTSNGRADLQGEIDKTLL